MAEDTNTDDKKTPTNPIYPGSGDVGTDPAVADAKWKVLEAARRKSADKETSRS